MAPSADRRFVMQYWLHKTIVSILLAIVGFFLVATYNRLSKIETDLAQVRVDLAKLSIPTKQDIREICRAEFARLQNQSPHGMLYPYKQDGN